PARKLDKSVAMRLPPEWKAHSGHHLGRFNGGAHIARRKRFEFDLTRSVRSRDGHDRTQRRGNRNEFGRGIEMAKRTAERAAVARLPMADLADRLVHQRTSLPQD